MDFRRITFQGQPRQKSYWDPVSTNKLGLVAHSWNPSSEGGIGWPWKKYKRPCLQKAKKTLGHDSNGRTIALLSKCKALSSNPSVAKQNGLVPGVYIWVHFCLWLSRVRFQPLPSFLCHWGPSEGNSYDSFQVQHLLLHPMAAWAVVQLQLTFMRKWRNCPLPQSLRPWEAGLGLPLSSSWPSVTPTDCILKPGMRFPLPSKDSSILDKSLPESHHLVFTGGRALLRPDVGSHARIPIVSLWAWWEAGSGK
jgi:hypothetical protein